MPGSAATAQPLRLFGGEADEEGFRASLALQDEVGAVSRFGADFLSFQAIFKRLEAFSGLFEAIFRWLFHEKGLGIPRKSMKSGEIL